MATEIVAHIDAAWSADKWKIKGRGTHRMIGPQQKKVDLHQCARDNRTERNGWLIIRLLQTMSTSASRRRRRGLVGAIELFWRPPALPLSASHLPPGLSSIDPPPSGASETLLFFLVISRSFLLLLLVPPLLQLHIDWTIRCSQAARRHGKWRKPHLVVSNPITPFNNDAAFRSSLIHGPNWNSRLMAVSLLLDSLLGYNL